MTIHTDHPFMPAEGDRSPLRRLRGRMPSPVTIWAMGSGSDRAGLTVSSTLLADGDPGRVVGLLDPDSDLWTAAQGRSSLVVSVLAWEQRQLADPFAGVAPAPGGVFRLGHWSDTQWGPALDGVPGWLGVRIDRSSECGWAVLVEGVVEHVELGEDTAPLIHRRGRYLSG